MVVFVCVLLVVGGGIIAGLLLVVCGSVFSLLVKLGFVLKLFEILLIFL